MGPKEFLSDLHNQVDFRQTNLLEFCGRITETNSVVG